MAYNLAKSIKRSSNIHITVLTDNSLNTLPDKPFDKILEPGKAFYREGQAFNPFLTKTRIYDLTPYDETLYLDVDALFLWDYKSIIDLFKELSEIDFHIHEVKRWNNENMDRCSMVWTKDAGIGLRELFTAYGLKQQEYPEYNSSFIWFKKTDKNEVFFNQAKKNYLDRKTPFRDIGGRYPDEMAWNLASAQLEHYTERVHWKPIFFQWENKEYDLHTIGEKYYFLGMAGGTTKGVYVTLYNRLSKTLPSPFVDFHNHKKIFHRKG